MKCFNCQQDGHIARDCQWHRELQAPPPLPAAPPPSLTRRPAEPPSADYLTAKAELGIPRNPHAVALLTARCPWCLAGPWQHCVNRATGILKHDPHEARYRQAGIDPPQRPALADVARRQADEARAKHIELS